MHDVVCALQLLEQLGHQMAVRIRNDVKAHVLEPKRSLQRHHATTRDRDLLIGDALQAKLQNAAGDDLDVLNMLKVDDIATVHAEEAVLRELLLELGQRNGGEVAVDIRVDAGVVVLGLGRPAPRGCAPPTSGWSSWA